METLCIEKIYLDNLHIIGAVFLINGPSTQYFSSCPTLRSIDIYVYYDITNLNVYHTVPTNQGAEKLTSCCKEIQVERDLKH